MNQRKYIVGEVTTDYGFDVVCAICFSNVIAHSHFRRSFNPILGAGFFSIGTDAEGYPSVSTFGASVSLNVNSRPEDHRPVARALGIHLDDDF